MVLIVLPSKQILCLFYWTWNSRLCISHPAIKIRLWNKQDCTAIWFESSVTEFLEVFIWSECVMRARIFYGSYNAVAMHRIVICKSSGDKHIDSKCQGWLWQEEMFHRDDRFSFAESSLAAVLSQHSPGMLAEASPTHPQMGGPSSPFSSHTCGMSWGRWLLWKRQSKTPLASWGHPSSWKMARQKRNMQ